MRVPSTLIARRLAGDDHAVITVTGGNHSYRRRPCEDCPWRTDTVGKFPAEAFRLSANTGAEHLNVEGERGRSKSCEASLKKRFNEASHTFGCHRSGTDRPATCAGYVLRGDSALGWRMAMIHGYFDPNNVSSGGCTLFESYYEMAVANGVAPDDLALAACKPWQPGDRGR